MDTSIIIVGLIMAALFIIPVVLLIRSGKKKSHGNE